MGYRDDPFFNVSWAGDGLEARASSGGIENSPFMFPDRGIRFLQAQAELERRFGTAVSTLRKGNYQLHRGYVRNLEQPQFGEIPISKCNFQFNPQEIRQSVQMREDMYLPLLQSVEQLSQPVGAVVNFTFDLMFDRSHEVSKGDPNSYSGSADSAERSGGDRGSSTADMYQHKSNDSYDIGVLEDLRVLYSVIGQGFSKEMLEFQKKKFTNYQDVRSNTTPETTTTTDADGNETTVTAPQTETLVAESDVDRLLQANYGNWGLLMPNPIRVMFSSLFMLDGFITGTNVDFLKFNTKMVPLMCRVTMNMSAMYIGFAREKTFLTDMLYNAGEAKKQADAEKAAQLAELATALSRTANVFTLTTAFDTTGKLVDWDKAANNSLTSSTKLDVWRLAVSDEASKNNGLKDRALFLGFPKIKPVKGGDTFKYVDGDKTQVKEGQDVDDVLAIFELNGNLTASYNWSIDVYGGKTEATKFATIAAANEAITKDNFRSKDHLGSFSGSESASSKAEWGAGTNEPGSGAKRIRRRSIRRVDEKDQLKNSASDRYFAEDDDDVPGWFKSAYYVVEVSVTWTFIAGESEITTTQSFKQAFSGSNESVYKRFNINWKQLSGTYVPVAPIRTT